MCASHLTLRLPPPPQNSVFVHVVPLERFPARCHANYDISLHQTETNTSTDHCLKTNKSLTLYLCIMQRRDGKKPFQSHL